MNSCMRLVFAVLMSLGMLSGCGGSATHFSTIEEIRRRASDGTSDPQLLAELGAGELLANGGNAAAAIAPLERATTLDSSLFGARFLIGMIHQTEGRHDAAASTWMSLIEDCAQSETPCTAIAEASAGLLSELENAASNFREIITSQLIPLLNNEATKLGSATRMSLLLTAIHQALRDGDANLADELEARAHCIQNMRVAGPFGPLDLIGFDEDLPADADQELAASYDLGATRGTRTVREIDSNACRLHLGNPSIQEGGTYLTEAGFSAPTAGLYDVWINSPNSYRLSIGTDYEFEVDRRQHHYARQQLRRIALPAGEHRVRVRLTSRHTNPVIALAIRPATGPNEAELPQAREHLSRFLRAVLALTRSHPIEAREVLRAALEEEQPSALLLMQGSLATSVDPSIPPSVRRDASRRLLTRSVQRNASAWYPLVQLARLRAQEGQVLQAITDLRPAIRTWPQSAEVPLALAELLLEREMVAEARALTRPLLEDFPHNCRVLSTALRAAQSANLSSEIEGHARALRECNARNSALYQWHVSRREWAAAEAEIDRLQSLTSTSDSYRYLGTRLRLAEGRGDRSAVRSLLAQATSIQPRAAYFARDYADVLLGLDETAQAVNFIEQALHAEPSAQYELRRVQRLLGADDLMQPWRLDGIEQIRAFEASGREYPQPDVLVLDHTVFRVLQDGSSIEVTHQIHRIQSEEAVDAHGEYSRPDNARILRLRTIKADGRVLEPDEIAGKDTISLPSLSPGDYVEVEYIRHHEPYRVGGTLGWRFFFEANETPFDLSRLTVIAPESMEIVVEPRGQAPQTETSTQDGYQVLQWTQLESRPRTPEPGSVSPQEYTASIQWGIDLSWSGYSRIVYDRLLDKDIDDPASRRLVQEILRESPVALTPHQKAARLFEWVLENIARTNDVFGQASWMIASRQGDRSRVLHYMLGLADIESRLVMVSQIGRDRTESEIPDFRRFDHLHVEIHLPGELLPVYGITMHDSMPFGYIPHGLAGQAALYIAPAEERTALPEESPIPNESTWDGRITLNADGSAEVHMQERHSGGVALTLRSFLENVPAAELEARMAELYISRILPGAQLESLSFQARENLQEPLGIEYTIRVDQIGRRNEQLWALPPIAAQLLTPQAARLPQRRTPAVLPLFPQTRVTLQVSAPEGYRFAEDTMTAASLNRVDLGASFESSRVEQGGHLTVTRRLQVTRSIIEPEEYPSFAEFCREADQLDQREIVLERIEP